MRNLVKLNSFTIVPGSTIPTQLKTIGSLKLVRNIFVQLTPTVNNPAGGGDETIAAVDKVALVSNALINRWRNYSGYGCKTLFRAKNGRDNEILTAHTATDGAVTSFTFTLPVAFMDKQLRRPDEASFPSEMLKDYNLDLTFAASTCYGGTLIVTGGLCEVFAEVVAVPPGYVPAISVVDELATQGQQIVLPGGRAISYAGFIKPTRTVYTTAEITNVMLTVDGQNVVPYMSPANLCALANDASCVDNAAAEIQAAGLRIPIVPHDRDAKIASMPYVDKGAQIQFAGSLASTTLLLETYEMKDHARINAIGTMTGIDPSTHSYRPNSGGSLSGLVGGKFVTSSAAKESVQRARGLLA